MATKKTNGGSNAHLYRSETNKVIAGVCGGLGDFFNIDPTIIRLIFILITIFGGGGLLLYIILWLIIPTSGSKGSLNEESIKKNAEEIKLKAQDFAQSTKSYAQKSNSRYLFGIILLVLGLTFLFDNFGFFRFFNIWKLWPILLIVLAFAILSKRD